VELFILEFFYYESGQLKAEYNYKNGKLDGFAREYYENGQLQDETPYKNDKKEGIVKTYIENGTLISEVTFKNGVMVGKSKLYNTKTGKLASVSNINNSKKFFRAKIFPLSVYLVV